MDESHLLKSQRNDVFAWLRAAGEDPRDFEWLSAHAKGEPADLLRHRETGHYFAIAPSTEYIFMEWRPGAERRFGTGFTRAWFEVGVSVREWLGYLRREIDAPDLWSSVLTRAEALRESSDPGENDPLTDSERQEVTRRVTGARDLLLNSGLDPEALTQANRKLDHLLDASGRVGRFDWRMLAIGVVVDIGINSAFDPERAQQLLDLLVGGVRHLLGG